MKYLLIPIFLLLSSCAYAGNWTKTDTAFQIAYTVVDTVDWVQTRYIAKHPIYNEMNPILGRHPQLGKVNVYFVGVELMGNFAISYVLPQPYRKIWQVTSIAVEATFINHNVNAGIGFKF